MCALRIIVDDASEVPPDLVAEQRWIVVPLVVRFGAEVHDDGKLTHDEYWAKAINLAHPQTAQPAPEAFTKAYRQALDEGDDVLCITISSKVSGTYNSACLAAQQFPGRVTVFDTLSVTWGSTLQALVATEMAEAGEPLPAILRRLEACRASVQMPILLNTVEWIRKGGRADRAMPMLEKVLRVFDIKPIITLVDGEVKIIGTVRSYEKGLSHLLDMMAEKGPYQSLAVFHTRQPEACLAFADRLAERLSYPRERILFSEVGPAISSHTGPLTMAAVGLPAGI